MELNDVLVRAADFHSLPSTEKVKLFAYCLHSNGKATFTTGEINQCFDRVGIARPTNTSQVLKDLSERKPPVILKPNGGFALERQARDAVKEILEPALNAQNQPVPGEQDSIFPLEKLEKTKRGYLVEVARQMNGAYVQGWGDACAVMMRRLVETSIIEAYEGLGIEGNVKNANNDYPQLTELIGRAINEPAFNLTRNAKAALPNLKNIGHFSAHSRRFNAHRSDIDKVKQDCRLAVEELLHIAKLL